MFSDHDVLIPLLVREFNADFLGMLKLNFYSYILKQSQELVKSLIWLS